MSQGKVRAILALLSAVAGVLVAFGVIPPAWIDDSLWASATALALALPTPGKPPAPKAFDGETYDH